MTNHFTYPSTCTSICASTSAIAAPALLSDRDLLDATARAAGDERRTTAELLVLLAELDTRKLYLGEGYSSLFTYCTQRLYLSESAAYGRITAARAARRFPILLARLADGDVTLTSISLLAAHLTDDNHESLLDAARHASRRDVERLVASLHAQPDIPAILRRMPSRTASRDGRATAPAIGPAREDDVRCALLTGLDAALSAPAASGIVNTAAASASSAVPVPAPSAGRAESSPLSFGPSVGSPPSTPVSVRTATRPVVSPLRADRYLLRVTISESTRVLLDRARDLLRHSIPNGDRALIVERALSVLVEQLEKRRAGRLARASRMVGAATEPDAKGPSADGPDATVPDARRPRSRHVPAAIKRIVWARDQGRCAFVGPHGRCSETGFLEYHHVVPFAEGGATDAANLELRCRAHNAYEAAVWFGEGERPGACNPWQ